MDQRPSNHNNYQGPEGPGLDGPGGPKNRSSILILLVCILATLMIWTTFSSMMQGTTSREISYSKFLEMLQNNQVAAVEEEGGMLTITPREQKEQGVEYQYSTRMMESGGELVNRLENAEEASGEEIAFNSREPDTTGSLVFSLFTLLVPVILLFVGMNWIIR